MLPNKKTLTGSTDEVDFPARIASVGSSWIGRAVTRREDDRLTTGRGCFVDDVRIDDCLHAVFVRAPFASGRIADLDLEAARRSPGVVAVFSADDIPELGHASVNELVEFLTLAPMPLLAQGQVGAVGQPVAMVIAYSVSAGLDAAALVSVDVVDDAEAPADAAAPALAHRWRHGDTEAAFAAAACTVSISIEHALVAPMALEPRAALAYLDENRLTIWLSTQTPHRARADLARILALDASHIRVIAPDVGGAFGGKSSIYPEEVLIAWAAHRIGKPVRWQASRNEEFLSATHGRGACATASLALNVDGTIAALKADLSFQQGHWMPFSAVVPARNAGRILPGPYRVPAVSIDAKGWRTSCAPVGIYRGAGRPEAAMLMERLMDAAARALSLDPIEIRRRNAIASKAFPYLTPTGETLDSGDYVRLLEKLVSETDYDQLRAIQRQRRGRGEIAGIGVALYVEPCGQGWETASLTLKPDGTVLLATGSTAQGQGRETAFAQLTAEALGVSPERVSVSEGDTDATSSGIGALASRSTAIGGSAVIRACGAFTREIAEAAAEVLQCAPSEIGLCDEGPFRTPSGQSITWSALAAHLDAANRLPSVSVRYEAEGEAWSSGACLATVSIDPETGVPTIERLVWIDDAGTVLNPMLAEGQMIGGMAQGFGEAMMERIVYDANGQLVTGSLMDYAVPRASDVPPLELFKIENPSPMNAFGAKGIGEAGCIGVPAAIANAVNDALSPFGIEDLQMPFTSDKLWHALDRARRDQQRTD